MPSPTLHDLISALYGVLGIGLLVFHLVGARTLRTDASTLPNSPAISPPTADRSAPTPRRMDRVGRAIARGILSDHRARFFRTKTPGNQ